MALQCSEIDSARVAWQVRQIHLVVPSVIRPGEPFTVRASAVGADHMPLGEHVTLRFEETAVWKGLPVEAEIPPEGVRLEDVHVDRAGAHFLTAELDGPSGSARISSNPVWADEDPPFRLFWGDIHVHSIDGWCQPHSAKDPEFGIQYARDVTFLDFVGVADHNDGLDGSKWARQKDLVRRYEEAGRFVPVLSFESSHASGLGGDNNVYFRGCEGDFLPREPNRQDDPLEHLWDFLESRGHEYMTIPHHTGRAAKYRSWEEGRYNPRREMLYEVYSMWGSSECHPSRYPLHGGNTQEPAYFVDALRQGCRFGVIASSDDHTTLPGSESPLRMPGRPVFGTYCHHGLAGVFADALDRESLWSAMAARRTMGVTYGRPLLFFQAEGQPAGSTIEINGTGPSASVRHLQVAAVPAFPERGEARITVLRNGEPIASKCCESAEKDGVLRVEITDDEPMDRVLLTDAPFSDRPFVVYHVRAETDVGGTAWSSPIWFVTSG